ncbi:hypothetical protein PVAG01_01995 [Phlyctema vagabunda]|uniref:STEEP1 domain-containing protein n=1 Tax=Phlyctema vagabunda TaxID=108571 RepID=A0ABR4PYY5_9HELO
MTTLAPPNIHTYHCLCTTLLLASTHDLAALPTRQTLDKAIILPVAALPGHFQTSVRELDEDPDASEEAPSPSNTTTELPQHGYTTLHGLAPDNAHAKAVTVRKDDGFERRVVWRCGRCRVVVGYEVVNQELDERVRREEVSAGGRERILYLLPGGLQRTNTMMQGKKILETEVELGNAGGGGVAVW